MAIQKHGIGFREPNPKDRKKQSRKLKKERRKEHRKKRKESKIKYQRFSKVPMGLVSSDHQKGLEAALNQPRPSSASEEAQDMENRSDTVHPPSTRTRYLPELSGESESESTYASDSDSLSCHSLSLCNPVSRPAPTLEPVKKMGISTFEQYTCIPRFCTAIDAERGVSEFQIQLFRSDTEMPVPTPGQFRFKVPPYAGLKITEVPAYCIQTMSMKSDSFLNLHPGLEEAIAYRINLDKQKARQEGKKGRKGKKKH